MKIIGVGRDLIGSGVTLIFLFQTISHGLIY